MNCAALPPPALGTLLELVLPEDQDLAVIFVDFVDFLVQITRFLLSRTLSKALGTASSI